MVGAAASAAVSVPGEAKPAVVEKNYEIFSKAMGNDWQIMPLAEMTANAAYTGAGMAEARGWNTGKGLRFFSDAWGDLSSATIPPEEAKKLCAGLGVDAVVMVSETWNIQQSFFNGQTVNDITVNMFDKDGTRVWGDSAFHRESDTSFGVPPPGVVAAEPEIWVKACGESMTKAVEGFRAHLASAP